MGISAIAANEDTLKPSRRGAVPNKDVLGLVKLNKIRVVLVSPETLSMNKQLGKLLLEGPWSRFLAAIIVDETHVVYDWGLALGKRKSQSAFRPEYGKLAKLRATVPDRVPILAVSATLCGPCLPAICKSLGFGRRPFFALDAGRERDGCSYDIQSMRHPSSTYLDLVELLPSSPKELRDLPKALIYTNTRAEADDAAEVLRARLPKELRSTVDSMTARDSTKHKEAILRRLRSGDLRIVAATEALGMGIDLPDVDLVV
ncbi:hypothetical protein CF319_g8964 [Tilletia indica]|nr:hypothetical protein CF319_g8964 [Tilletia indica]